MSVLNLLFSNASGYTDAEVSVLFYGGNNDLDVSIVGTDAPIASNKWYRFTDLSAGVHIKKISGRIYFCYGETFSFSGPQAQTPTAQSFFDRYDKFEITFKGNSADVANLTSIDFWSIPLQLTTFKSGVQVGVVRGLLDNISALDVYNSLIPLTTPPVSGLPDAIPALVPGQFTQSGNGPTPKPTFGRIIGPSVYPSSPGLPALPYDTMESYLSWLNATFGQGTGTATIPGLGNGTIAIVKGEFAGVGPNVPSSGPQSQQGYSFTVGIDNSLNITMQGTVGSGTVSTTLAIATSDLFNPTGIYGANPPVSLNGGTPAALGNNVYSWAVADFLSGLSIGAVGSSVQYQGKAIGGMDSSSWFFGNLPASYMFSGAQSSKSNYNQYAATLHGLSDAYGFPYAERFTHVFAGLNPAVVDTLEVSLLEAVLPPEFLVDSKNPWQSTGVNVTGGETITYQGGKWTANPGDNNGNLYDANGNPTFIDTPTGYAMPGQNMGMLVGMVGGTVFAIGNKGKVPKGLSGVLELCINDDLNGLYGAGLTDNIGSVRVLIKSS